MTGRLLDEKMGRCFFWLFVIGFNLTFLVQHALGIMGMPRRVYTYPDLPLYGIFNFISTCGAFLMGDLNDDIDLFDLSKFEKRQNRGQ